MKVSVFTPTHGTAWLNETYESLIRQTYDDWQWVLLPNGGYKFDEVIHRTFKTDPRVKILENYEGSTNIGALKNFACDHCDGELFAELDHDDVLTETALEKTVEAYKSAGTDNVFLFSDSASFYENGNGSCVVYDGKFGWEHYPFEYHGITYTAMRAFPVTPRSLCEIFYAPNHIRVWSREAYRRSKGHDPKLRVGDDHDLVCRTYLAGSKFVHLPECLYMYRVHGKNTCIVDNPDVIKQQTNNMNKYLYPMTEKWSLDNNLKMIDLGSAHNKPKNFLGIDMLAGEGVDIVCDVTNGLPFEENSVGVIRAVDFLEHIPPGRVISLMNEFYRVLAPGGWLCTHTPSTDGRGAFQDPTHISFWNSNSFWYYTNKDFSKFIPEYKGRFQATRIWNDNPSEWHQFHNIVYVHADLYALKGQRTPGMQLI